MQIDRDEGRLRVALSVSSHSHVPHPQMHACKACHTDLLKKTSLHKHVQTPREPTARHTTQPSAYVCIYLSLSLEFSRLSGGFLELVEVSCSLFMKNRPLITNTSFVLLLQRVGESQCRLSPRIDACLLERPLY